MTDLKDFVGAWCTFPVGGLGYDDKIKIGEVEEIGERFGQPYIRFRASTNDDRVIELLGVWSILSDPQGSYR
jgi:hypothetical protein